MKVKVSNKIYRMSLKEYEGLLEVAKEQVPFGIYAVEKSGYAELLCDRCQSMTQLKKMTQQFKTQGFKVHANKFTSIDGADGVAKEGLMSAT